MEAAGEVRRLTVTLRVGKKGKQHLGGQGRWARVSAESRERGARASFKLDGVVEPVVET